MTSWTDSYTDPIGDVVYLLEIVGVGVFTTLDYTPTDSWFTTAGYGAGRVYPWLKYDLEPITQSIEYLEGELKVNDIGVSIVDIDGQFTELMKSWRNNIYTYATTNIADDDTNISVDQTTGFASTTNSIHIGQEVIEYTGITSNAFTGCTRGKLGTIGRAYTVNLATDSEVPDRPVVTDGLASLSRRKCYLHAAFIDPGTGAPGTTSVIYRGTITSGIKRTPVEARLTIEHVSAVFKKKVGTGFAQTEVVPGFYVCGSDAKRYGATTKVNDNGTIRDVTINAGWYTAAELIEAWNGKVNSVCTDVFPLLQMHEDTVVLSADVGGGEFCKFRVFYGSVLYFLGFPAGRYSSDTGVDWEVEADDPPRLFGLQWGDANNQPQFVVRDPTLFSADQHVQLPGNSWGRVKTTTSTRIVLEPESEDPLRSRRFWVIDDEEDDMVCQQVLVLGDPIDGTATLTAAMKRCFYLLDTATTSEHWCATGLWDDDIDFGDLDDLLGSLPLGLDRWYDCITEPIEAWAIFQPVLGVLAIAPKVKADGVISWTRMSTPVSANAEAVEVDDDMWAALQAREVECNLADNDLLTQVSVKHSKNYAKQSGGTSGDKEWGTPVNIFWHYGFAQRGDNKTQRYEIRGWQVGVRTRRAMSLGLAEFAISVDKTIKANHFGVFGRENFKATIPCTWRSRNFECGDIVKVTHPMLPDPLEGTLGVTERLGLVVGLTHQTTQRTADSIEVLFTADANGAGLAPCALGDSWTVGTLTMGFSGADIPVYAQSGGNDLDEFNAGDNVILVEYDDTSGAEYTATIDTVDPVAKEVVFTSDPFGGGGIPANGVWLNLCAYNIATAAQKVFAYIADAGTNPTLGSGNADHQTWTV